ncbi:cysteine-rich receptor-like protein kinase 29 [Vicia villosa]|uniref:cysteine-rich receptor-like protein kinase 29 n=1 Tax=Vicia villosa TaxID=3911 RepID=UPI00273C9194|nr:cysteine-rich receptor-like protein kinase 29 [Vicia villosa]
MAIVSCKLLFSFYSFLLLLVIIVSQTNAQPDFIYRFCINDKGNYTTNSTYQKNLNTLLSNLTSNTQINYGFYNFSHGQNNDKVNAIGLCRGDVTPDVCRNCLNDSRLLLTKLCPNQKEAMAGYDLCMLRYSNRSIFGIKEDSPDYPLSNPDNASEADQFNQVLGNLMRKLKKKAASSDSSTLKFAADSDSTDMNFQTIYGLVQCTPDLSSQDCNDCLEGAISQIPTCCDKKIGARVIKPSCNIRYENYRFYNLTSQGSPQEKCKSSLSTIAIVVSVVAVGVVAAMLSFFCIYLMRSKKKIKREEIVHGHDDIEIVESLQFDFDTIQVATNNFSEDNKLGHGGFGVVYQGKLSNGQVIAVKRLSKGSGQGDREFKNEVLLLAKLQHRNLVKLHGFCLERKERLLIYEFVPNKSLDYFIFDPIKRTQLDWERLYKIISGIVKGLLYLHEDSRLRIIHRDLKASNILLDNNMNPKISDFGLARLILVGQTQVNTEKIVGTYGYMAPEYAMFGKFSIKSDVFSFGVLIIEIITGQKVTGILHEQSTEDLLMEDLLSFVWRNWREGTIINIIDPSLNNSSQKEIMRCIQISLLCVQEKVVERPTMATIARMLNSYSVSLPLPLEPASVIASKPGSHSISDMQSGEDSVGIIRSSQSKNISANDDSSDEL